MNSFGGVLYLIFRIVCYCALAVVLAGLGALVLATASGSCSSSGGMSMSCDSDLWKALADFGLTILLLTVFTGVPGLLAIAGAFFGLRELYMWRVRVNAARGRPANLAQSPVADAAGAEPPQAAAPGQAPSTSASSGFGKLVLKILLGILGLAFFGGIIAGMFGA